MKKLFAKVSLLSAIFILTFTVLANATLPTSDYANKSKYDYVIKNYNVDIQVNEDNTFDTNLFSTILMYVVPALGLIISVIIWRKFGKEEEIVETVEYYPPEGFNSLEVAYLYKGSVDSKDVISLFVYLANKGYIKIIEKKSNFKIIKLKDYDGNNENERIFLEGLYKYGTDIQGEVGVTLRNLNSTFYQAIDTIKSRMNIKKNKKLMFESYTTIKSIGIIMMIILSIFILIGVPIFQEEGLTEAIIKLLPLFALIPFYAIVFFGPFQLVIRLFCGFWTLLMSYALMFQIFDKLANDEILLYAFLLGIVCVIGMFVCLKAMPKRTAYGNKVLQKVKGFKTFLEVTEKEQMEAMIMKDPTYFYDILPYIYVLDVSNKWIKKITRIFYFNSLKSQESAKTDEPYYVATFCNAINEMIYNHSNEDI